ncbi:hypothetical protein BKA62DRAFT_818572 [Auriculariales sp. MPI-PUGE-AT-0066]|nr:hypothetical protein BKA62DRAFT_818572 [Auriculariales sp. MPI-PUGE-AT-0066]
MSQDKKLDQTDKFNTNDVEQGHTDSSMEPAEWGITHLCTYADANPLGQFSANIVAATFNAMRLGTLGIDNTRLMLGIAIAAGGVVEMLAAQWSDTFGATAYMLGGALWLSFGLQQLPGLGAADSYVGDTADQLDNALATYVIMWWLMAIIYTNHRLEVIGACFGLTSALFGIYAGSVNLFVPHNTWIRLPNPMMPQWRWNRMKQD